MMQPEVLIGSIFALTISMVLLWFILRSSRMRLWTDIGLCLVLGWSATGLLAAGNTDLADGLAKITFCAFGLTVLFVLIGPPNRTKGGTAARTKKRLGLPDEGHARGSSDE
jgi:hypothetical protein